MYDCHYKKDLFKIIFFVMVVFITGYGLKELNKTEDRIVVMAEALSPTVSPLEVSPTPKTITPTPRVYSSEIEAYIYEVFGVYGDKAMLLLKGNKECPGENPSLNPKAVYTNIKGMYKGSRDRGIFQINDVIHPYMTDERAFNYKENVDYAFRMFKNDGYTFKRWSAGKCLAI